MEGESSASNEDRLKLSRIGETLMAYLKASTEMLKSTYSGIRDLAPPQMTDACFPTAFLFPDGILIRYDLQANPDLKVRVGLIPEQGTLAEWAPRLSESFVHCPVDADGYDPGDQAVTLTLSTMTPSGQHLGDLSKIRLFAAASLQRIPTEAVQRVQSRPIPLISVRNEFDLALLCQMASQAGSPGRQFVVRSRFRIPVGWEAIEVYPPYEPEGWEPNLASLWAETDLLAAAVRQNLQDAQLRAIDPNAQARKRMAELLTECRRLLEGPEEPVHQFIKTHPELLSPTHVRMWSKLALGKRATDFVFREPSGDYLLVELEQALHPLFRDDGQQRAELTHAVDQVMEWRRYLEDNLSTAQRELGLDGISSSPRCLIVMGRSASLTEGNRRKLMTLENATPRLKIMTFDDLLDNAKAAVENMLGPLWDPGPNAEVYFLS
jgi:hypothetical protein